MWTRVRSGHFTTLAMYIAHVECFILTNLFPWGLCYSRIYMKISHLLVIIQPRIIYSHYEEIAKFAAKNIYRQAS